MRPPGDAVLCYVDGSWAWFTTRALEDQWGDDWNDAPYRYNAGDPYGPLVIYKVTGPEKDPRDWNEDGTPKWDVYPVAFRGPFETGWHPDTLSVQDINAGAMAWIKGYAWDTKHRDVYIKAGATFAEFCNLVRRCDGRVYVELGVNA